MHNDRYDDDVSEKEKKTAHAHVKETKSVDQSGL